MKRRIFTGLMSLAMVFGLAAGGLPARAETTPSTVVTEGATEPTAEAPTVPSTEPVTEPTAEAPTEPTTVPVTEAPTEPATETGTEPGTEPSTEAAGEPSTDPLTEPAERTEDVQTQVGELSVTVHDAPAGVTLRAEEVYLPSLFSHSEGRGMEVPFDRSLDLKLYLGEEEYQPENGPVTVSIQGFSQSDLERDEFVVTHYLDTPEAVEQALAEGRAFSCSAEGLSDLYPRECEAALAVTGQADTVFYTAMTRRNGGLSCQNGSIFLQVDSFSSFNIKQYHLLHGRPVIPDIESDKAEDRMVLNKFVSEEEDGTFSLYLESYATGFMKARPTEVVLVMDHSGSMYSAMNSGTVYSYKGFLEAHPTGSGNETYPGYYLCMTKNSLIGEGHQEYAAALVWWKDGRWVRSQQVEISKEEYHARKTGFTFPDWKLHMAADLTGYNYDSADAVYFKTVAGAAMDGMQAFLTEIEGLPDCKVAVTGFATPRSKIQKAYDDGDGLWESQDTASNALIPRRMGGTGVYVNGRLHVDGVDLNVGDYGNAFLRSDDPEEFALLRRTVHNIQTSYWNTVTEAGFAHANEIFKANESGGDTARIVVLFTDGKPDSLSEGDGDAAQAAVAAARISKETYGAEVYAFGPADLNSDPDAASLMNSLSSNAEGKNNYVGFADDAESLKRFFAELGQKIVYDNFLMGPETVLRDVISESFALNGAPEAWSVPVIVGVEGIAFDNDPTHWQKLENVNISVKGGTIDVTGFNYRENLIPVGEAKGGKLVVKIPIQVAEGYDGDGRDVPTNGPGSGIFDKDGSLVNSFREPAVDLTTRVTVRKTVVGRDFGDAFGFETAYTALDRYENAEALQTALAPGGNSFGGNRLDAVTVPVKNAFKLKNGGRKSLDKVMVGSVLTIRELEHPLYTTTVKVNGQPADFGPDGNLAVTVTPNMTIEFINTSRLADLTIVKRGADIRDENQTFLFHIRGLDADNSHIDLTVTVLGNDTVTVKDLPLGRYQVTEDESWSWRYEAVSMEGAGGGTPGASIFVRLMPEGETVICTNRRREDRWLDGSSCCRNLFGPDGIEKT